MQRRLVGRGSIATSGPVTRTGSEREPALDQARRTAWVVEVAARRGPWSPNCLHRSLVLWSLLERRGIPGELRIGARRRPGGAPGEPRMDFHAWVEYGGTVLNDVPDVRDRFVTFDVLIAPRDQEWS